MNNEFLRGMCIGALAGATVEVLMMVATDKATKRTGNPMRAMGNAVEDVVDNITHTFH